MKNFVNNLNNKLNSNKTSLGVLIMLICFQMNISAQNSDTTKYKNEFRIGLIQPLYFGAAYFSYERYFDNKNSFVGSFDITSIKSQSQEVFGYMVELQYRYYLLNLDKWPEYKKHWEGYIAPSIKIRNKELIYPNDKSQIKSYGFSFVMGVKYIVFGRATIDVNAGLQIKHSNIFTQRQYHNYDYSIFSDGYTGIAPYGNITIGFKF